MYLAIKQSWNIYLSLVLWPSKQSFTQARNLLFHLMRQCTRKQKIRIWESEHIRLAVAFVLEIYPDRLKITRGTLGAMLKVALGRAAVFTVHVTTAGSTAIAWLTQAAQDQHGRGAELSASLMDLFSSSKPVLCDWLWRELLLSTGQRFHVLCNPMVLRPGVNHTAVFTRGSVRRISAPLQERWANIHHDQPGGMFSTVTMSGLSTVSI